jgi:hypothetical protein
VDGKGLVGIATWEKLSGATRFKMLDEELAQLAAEQLELPTMILTYTRRPKH